MSRPETVTRARSQNRTVVSASDDYGDHQHPPPPPLTPGWAAGPEAGCLVLMSNGPADPQASNSGPADEAGVPSAR
jgi:hypothetical protein